MESDEQCGQVWHGVRCQLRVGHVPEVHVSGRRGSTDRQSWLLGRRYDTDVADSDLEWADRRPEMPANVT